MTFENYETESFYDEMFLPDGSPRPEARQLVERIEGLPDGELVRRHQTAERSLLHTGITFTVYGDEAGTERIFPFDIVPRIVSRETWDPIERGLKQRVEALNLFIDDVYHDRRIVRDGLVPADVVESSQGYRTECIGIDPPRGVWCHITGTDLVRDGDGTIYVLEDNLRCPSGVSWRSRWGWSWSRGATSWWRTTACRCARRASGSTSCTAGSTTTSSTRPASGPTPCSAFPA